MAQRTPLPERRVERIVLGVTVKELERFDNECEREGLTRAAMLRKLIGERLPEVMEV